MRTSSMSLNELLTLAHDSIRLDRMERSELLELIEELRERLDYMDLELTEAYARSEDTKWDLEEGNEGL